MKGVEILKNTCDYIKQIAYDQLANHAEDITLMNSVEDNVVPDYILEIKRRAEEISEDKFESILQISDVLLELSQIEFSFEFCKNENLKIVAIILAELGRKMEREDWDIDIEYSDDLSLHKIRNRVVHNMLYNQEDDRDNKMLLLDFSDMNKVKSFFEENENINSLLLILLQNIKLNESYESVLLCKLEDLDEQTKIKKIDSRISFVEIVNILQGKSFFEPNPYVYQLPNINYKFDDRLNYLEFNDIVDVMSEYNSQEYILDKYLRIYQVIENFMYKMQICELCEGLGYRKLTIRDFKSISDRLSKSEMDSLLKLIDKIGTFSIDGKEIKTYVYDCWKNILKVDSDVLMCNKVKQARDLIGLENKKGDPINVENLSENDVLVLFSKFIYKIRCSLVHNKVNEYHITYSNLDENIKWILEKFIMPNLELIVYGMMINKNEIIMYKQQELLLY